MLNEQLIACSDIVVSPSTVCPGDESRFYRILSKTVSDQNHGNNASRVTCYTSKKLTNIAG